ncbi:MAG: ATP-binding protein, partial [Pseudomonadota bacterium]
GEQAREDILDGYVMQLLAAAEPNEAGALSLPIDLFEARFNSLGSGLYAELRGDGGVPLWQSQSALGLALPFDTTPELGVRVFQRESLEDGTPLLSLSLAVQWEFPDGSLRPYTFKVTESLDSFNAQISQFRRQLLGWFGAVAIIMLVAIAILMRGLLRPLRQIETEIGEIEEGQRAELSGRFPAELEGVARNMNLLIETERARSDRYRYTLDNLAHSLKTPLAAMRALIGESSADDAFNRRADEQIDRMDEIVRYQLRKPAATDNLVLKPVAVAEEVERLVAGLRKVYRDKAPEIRTAVGNDIRFRADTGDFLELAGNLLDNACKWCGSAVEIRIEPASRERGPSSGLELVVGDDGPGIPEDAVDGLLTRGTRLDESTPGHGIGLAIVSDIARSYGGTLDIGRSAMGGAEMRVTIPPVAARRTNRAAKDS